MSPSSKPSTGNLFLDSLSTNSLNALRPSLVKVSLKHRETVYDSDGPINTVQFPIAGIISIVLVMADGANVEVGIIGREGMSGLPIALGVNSSNERTFVQIPGTAYRCSVSNFRSAINADPDFKASCLRYAQGTFMSSAQLSACNNLHTTNQRCARWLLMAHDRVNGNTFFLTQEFLGQMLGVRRPGVSVAASTLQRAGLIEYSRGHITIRNRAGLETTACECYATLEDNWEQLMNYSVRKDRLIAGAK